jgi:hypothetical protein
MQGPLLPRIAVATVALATVLARVPSARGADPPLRAEFRIAGHDAQADRLNAMFRLHYGPRTACTLWDPWMPHASLWEAAAPDGTAGAMRAFLRDVLLTRRIDDEGYVATQQHRGLAHADGWPFPTWQQAQGVGWHFSMADEAYAVSLGTKPTGSLDGWGHDGLRVEGIDRARGAVLAIEENAATLTTPAFRVESLSAPFARLEWATAGLPAGATAAIEWETAARPGFDAARRLPIRLPTEAEGMVYAMVPLHRHPDAGGTLTRFRLRVEGAAAGTVTLKSLITAVDSRHPINNAVYITACADYYDITTDREFLRAALPRLRRALRYALDEFDVEREGCVRVPWVGHDGRSGLARGADGAKVVRVGLGVGNNYWDLLPFGGHDFQATLYLFHALGRMADLEREADALAPALDPAGRFDPNALRALAATVRERSAARFWNPDTGRFVGWIDADGRAHDMGLTTLNTEAIHYGLATEAQARSILDWLDGRRAVAGDTSTGADLYRWRFAPRATTRRNVETYVWAWSAPESVPWGDQVQDGGAVLGWSYFDLMARLRVDGPDGAWDRLRAILDWFGEVQAEGGYRAYYAKPGRGRLQGGGTPGGLGLDAEFFESLLVPQFVVDGFLGLRPVPGGMRLRPRLPRDWPGLTVAGVHVQGVVLDVTAAPGELTLRRVGAPASAPAATLRLDLEPGRWEVQALDAEGRPDGPAAEAVAADGSPVPVDFATAPGVRLRRRPAP